MGRPTSCSHSPVGLTIINTIALGDKGEKRVRQRHRQRRKLRRRGTRGRQIFTIVLKSGMPAFTDIPAPASTTMFWQEALSI